MPSVPLDLLDFDARWKQGERPSDKPAPAVPKDFTGAKVSISDPRANVLGSLHRPITPEEIARFTGQLPEIVVLELLKMESEGIARRNDAGLWQLVPKHG